jgi:hypothetical protein
MSGRRWIFILLASVPLIATGCQVDGGNPKMWNPFARTDKDKFPDEELPKFVRRISDNEKEDSDSKKTPIAESRVESLLADGQLALQENRIPDARRVYKEVLEFLPDDPTANHGMAMAADLTENWAEAESHYRQALRGRPRDANLLCDIGYSYLLQNRYSEASSYLTQAIQINPNHENAHTNLALLDVRQGNPDAARTRLMQRYGDSAKVTQILAALQSQTRTSAASTLAANVPTIPENATFEKIREIANRERIAAEQRRAAQSIPVDHDPGTNPVNIVSDSNVADPYQSAAPQYQSAAPQVVNQQPIINQQPGNDPGTNANVAGGNVPPNNNLRAGYSPNMTGQMQSAAVAQYGANPGFGPQSNPYPLGANSNMHPTYSNAAAPVGAWNQNSPTTPGMSANPQAGANTSQANYEVNQQPFTQGNQAPPTPNGASLSGVIAVRPSGAFQPPTQGVSYGQPIGFSQPSVETAGYQNNGNSPISTGNMSNGNSVYANEAYQNTRGPANGNMAAPQNSPYSQSHPQMQLEGLNVGLGSLFPVGQGTGSQNGTLKMGNVSAPGSNSAINGAMYGQPPSILPSQEWMMQQQEQIQQLRSQTQMPNQNGQGYPDQTNSGPGNDQRYPNSQNFGNNPANNPYGNTGTTTAPRPGVQTPPVNPLATYENQLRQLDNQYNSTLQQLDRNATAAVPRAQY